MGDSSLESQVELTVEPYQKIHQKINIIKYGTLHARSIQPGEKLQGPRQVHPCTLQEHPRNRENDQGHEPPQGSTLLEGRRRTQTMRSLPPIQPRRRPMRASQTIRRCSRSQCHPRSLARKELQVPPRIVEKRRVQR